jgi:hypothetical protein
MIGYTGVKLLLAELSIAYIIIASSHNRRRPFHFLTNRRRNRRQNLILEREREREFSRLLVWMHVTTDGR